MSTTDDDDDERAFGDLYAASYARLVGVVGVVAQDRQEAEEAVQDAFVRLMGQWPNVSRYDDPEAWVRKVAFGFVSNRRRKIRNGLRAALRHGAAPDTPAMSGDAVDLRRALAALSVPQRQVIVLQDLGLGVADIARQLDIPVGTVKSRLSRARAALAPLLREDANDHV
ncbi:MAG: sigma-70 family RNA polymerase sigma factor [Frankiaceae bacterium]|nr:sigma-70 family RNA polymerase sigma factor [Frankiaceae bacterium]